MPKSGSDKLITAKLIVRHNDINNMERVGGKLIFTIPPEELKRIEEEEQLKGLTGVEVYFFFNRNAPLAEFPKVAEEMIEQGFELDLYKLKKFTKAERKALRLLTPQEMDDEMAPAPTSVEPNKE